MSSCGLILLFCSLLSSMPYPIDGSVMEQNSIEKAPQRIEQNFLTNCQTDVYPLGFVLKTKPRQFLARDGHMPKNSEGRLVGTKTYLIDYTI